MRLSYRPANARKTLAAAKGSSVDSKADELDEHGHCVFLSSLNPNVFKGPSVNSSIGILEGPGQMHNYAMGPSRFSSGVG